MSAEDVLKYRLAGRQVEPTASLWLDDVSHIRVPTIRQVKRYSEAIPSEENDHLALDFKNDYPFIPSDSDGEKKTKLRAELEVLVALQNERNKPYPAKVQTTSGKEFPLTPISRFLNLQPIPFGTIFDDSDVSEIPIENVLEQHTRILTNEKVVNKGSQLARIFENETPGLYHRHALNWIFFNRADISPSRQARIWMALDITIYAALSAAWHYKWLREPYNRLLRPEEYDDLPDEKSKLTVLFDRNVKSNGAEVGEPRDCPRRDPGTPRHPAWPSGHSTFSAAASRVLEYFFSPDTIDKTDDDVLKLLTKENGKDDFTNPLWIALELRRLGNNIGEARLWAGVHWISDHKAGQKIGRSAAEAVIFQLKRDCIPKSPPPPDLDGNGNTKNCDNSTLPPTNEEIVTSAGRGNDCVDNRHDQIEQPPKVDGKPIRKNLGNF